MQLIVIQQTGSELISARFSRDRATLRFLEGARQQFDPETGLLPAVTALKTAGSDDARVILALSPASVFFRPVTLPVADRKKLKELLPLELKGETALEGDGLLFDALPLSTGNSLALWAKTDLLQRELSRLMQHGIEPELVTVSMFAWDRLLPAGNSDTVAISDGEGVAVYQGSTPCFFRNLDPHARQEQLQQSLAALEIGSGIHVDRILLHGKFTTESCPELTPAPVQLELHGGLADAFGTDAASALELSGAYAVAHAAAFGDPVNFRTGPLTYTRNRDRFRKKLRLTAILAVAVVLLLFAELGVRYFLVKKDLASLDSSIRTIYSTVFPNRKKAVDEVAELRSEIRRLNMGNAGSSVLETMKQIALAKGDDISAVYELEIDGNQVRGKGDARSAQAATEFKARTAKFLSGVEVSEIKSRPDGSVGFTFRATGKEGGK